LRKGVNKLTDENSLRKYENKFSISPEVVTSNAKNIKRMSDGISWRANLYAISQQYVWNACVISWQRHKVAWDHYDLHNILFLAFGYFAAIGSICLIDYLIMLIMFHTDVWGMIVYYIYLAQIAVLVFAACTIPIREPVSQDTYSSLTTKSGKDLLDVGRPIELADDERNAQYQPNQNFSMDSVQRDQLFQDAQRKMAVMPAELTGFDEEKHMHMFAYNIRAMVYFFGAPCADNRLRVNHSFTKSNVENGMCKQALYTLPYCIWKNPGKVVRCLR
jgi:hypothetical protein